MAVRIVVLAHNLRVAGGLSVGKNIVAALPKAAPQHKYLMVVPAGLGYEQELDTSVISIVEVPIRGRVQRAYFDLRTLPKIVDRFKPDVILGLGNLGLTHHSCKQAFLFHKSQLTYPRRHYQRETVRARSHNWLLKQHLRRCLKSTQLVFCQTPVAKARFSQVFSYPAEQIVVMPNAVSEFVKCPSSVATKPPVFDGNKKFTLFYLAKYCGHKNLEVLIDVFRDYPDRLADVRCIVTVAAEQHPNAPKFLRDIERYHLDQHIVNVGPLAQEQLPGYFSNADALLFPSTLESFTATYLEAMHFGLPILTSDLDFAHDICADAGVYFDPWNPADIVENICVLKND